MKRPCTRCFFRDDPKREEVKRGKVKRGEAIGTPPRPSYVTADHQLTI